jgi:hypothetical protein
MAPQQLYEELLSKMRHIYRYTGLNVFAAVVLWESMAIRSGVPHGEDTITHSRKEAGMQPETMSQVTCLDRSADNISPRILQRSKQIMNTYVCQLEIPNCQTNDRKTVDWVIILTPTTSYLIVYASYLHYDVIGILLQEPLQNPPIGTSYT